MNWRTWADKGIVGTVAYDHVVFAVLADGAFVYQCAERVCCEFLGLASYPAR